MLYFSNKKTLIIAACCTAMSLQIATCGTSVVANKPAVEVARAPERLKHGNMEVLNAVFSQSPEVAILIEASYRRAGALLKGIDKVSDKADTVAQHISKVAEPVIELLATLKKHAKTVTPLMEESLDKKATMIDGVRTVSVASGMYAKSYLKQLLEDPADASTFFKNRITSREILEKICKEYVTFFGDVRQSYSQEALRAIQNILKTRQASGHNS
jgi:hypothetical protein